MTFLPKTHLFPALVMASFVGIVVLSGCGRNADSPQQPGAEGTQDAATPKQLEPAMPEKAVYAAIDDAIARLESGDFQGFRLRSLAGHDAVA